jgi:hypothetical protein
MLRLSEEDGAAVAGFQAMHTAAREVGFRRIFHSPTLFEDMVKCILLCNCQLSLCLGLLFLFILPLVSVCDDYKQVGFSDSDYCSIEVDDFMCQFLS